MAANRIKGITIEIGGDTTKLQTALKGVNTEIRNTQSQLKDVNKLLKLDPGNTELIAQKHKLLGQAVEETKQKLETLKTAQQQADEALKNGTISKDQYDALQREIIETEQELKRLEDQANQSATALQKISATGEKLKTVGDNISGVGKKLLPVTGAVTAAGVASVKTAADFESSMSKVSAVSGATGGDLDALSKKAREMGSKTKFLASEAAEAMNYMAMAGWKTEDMLGGIEGVMNLAAASGENLATTSDIVTDALTAFGLTANDSGHFADVLAAASSNANTNVSMMGETFKYCAPIAGSLGFSVEDTAEAIGLMANAGIKSSQAGTSLRTIMTNLTGDVKICGSSIGEVTVATTNADGSMRDLSDILADCRTAFSGLTESEKASAAESLVGKNAMSGFLALMNAGEGDINKLSGAIDNCDGKAKDMADTMNNNLEGQLTILKSQLQELAISFGEILLPAVKNIVGWIQGFVNVLNSLPDGVKQTIVTIALIAAALGPVLIIVGKVISAVGTIMTIIPKLVSAFNMVKTAFAALSAVLVANPIILIVAAVAAAIAAVVLLYQKCEWFRDAVNAVWQAVSDFFVQIWNGIIGFFTDTIPNVWNSVVAFFQGIPEWWSNLWSSISDFFNQIWTGMMNNPVLSAITDLIRNLWTNLVTTLQGIWSGLTTIASAAFELLKNVILGLVLLLIDLVTGNFTKLKEDVSKIWTNMKETASQIWSGLKQVVGSLAQGLATHVSTLITGLKNILSNLWSSMVTTATNLWTNLKNTVSNLADTIKNSAVTAFKNLVSGIGSALSGLGSVVQNGFQSAISFITSLPGKALQWGADFVHGIANGIRSAIGAVTDAVGSVAEKIRSVLHFSVPDEGPLTDYESWMPDFMKGLAKGIDRSRYLVAQAMNGVAENMVIRPKVNVGDMALAGGGSVSSADMGSLLSAIREAMNGNGGQGGDIVIPVYVGGTMLDEVIVNVQQRANLRSGGR